jgi:hypothetical protein
VLRPASNDVPSDDARACAPPPPPHAAAVRDRLAAHGRVHLELLEADRKLYLRCRALTLAQRGVLYARDELEMAVMRLRLQQPGERVKPHEQHFKLHPAALPAKNKARCAAH